MDGPMTTLTSCPACPQPAELIPLGARRDHPYRWRWWITTLTHIYLCAHCDALVQVRANGELLVETVSGPASRGALGPVQPPQTAPRSGAIPPARSIWPAAA